MRTLEGYRVRAVLNSHWVVWMLISLVFYMLTITIWFYPCGNQQEMSTNPFTIGAVYCSKYCLESLGLCTGASVHNLAWPFKKDMWILDVYFNQIKIYRVLSYLKALHLCVVRTVRPFSLTAAIKLYNFGVFCIAANLVDQTAFVQTRA